MRSSILFKSLFLSAGIAFLLNSCTEKEMTDTVKPVINLIEPAQGETLRIGNEVHLEMELSDNEALGAYKIEIHSNFDDHGHGSASRAATESVAFSFNRSWTLAPQKNTLIHHHEIVIPENAMEGKYHLMVFCTDMAGNESYIARNIVLSHEGGEDHEHE
ncbi:MAG: DUF4625 domain-containing protein [Bacteroidales bacterium]